MKKYLFLLPLILIVSGCYQKTTDLSKPLQQVANSIAQLNQKVDMLANQVKTLENKNGLDSGSLMGWQTFTDYKYYFTLKLPPDWVQFSEFDGSEFPIHDSDSGIANFGPKGKASTNGIAILADVGKEGCGKNRVGERLIGAQTFQQFQTAEGRCFLAAHKGVYYSIVVLKTVENDLADKILSTFTFFGDGSTADWKTYTSEKYGFSMSYPNLFTLTEEDFDKFSEPKAQPRFNLTLAISNEPYQYAFGGPEDATIDVSVSTEYQIDVKTKAENLDDILQKSKAYTNLRQTKVNEIETLQYDQEPGAPVSCLSYLLFNGGKFYNIQMCPTNSKYKEYFPQVLSTFKFTK